MRRNKKIAAYRISRQYTGHQRQKYNTWFGVLKKASKLVRIIPKKKPLSKLPGHLVKIVFCRQPFSDFFIKFHIHILLENSFTHLYLK
jgi:hypothetical protein